MIYFALAALSSISLFNYSVSRNILYPPLIFSGTWLLSIMALVLSGDTFYPVTTEALSVYLVGAIFFSLGGLYFLKTTPEKRRRPAIGKDRVARIHRALDVGLLCVLVGLPFYIMRIAESVDLSDFGVLATLRALSVETSASSQRSFSVVNNLVVISTFVALAMHYEDDGTAKRRRRSFLAIIVAVIYGALTGSKGWVTIFPTLALISFIGKKRVGLATMAWAAGLTLALFAAGLLMINYVSGFGGNSWDAARVIAETLQNYWLGGLVAFNRIVEAPESIASVQSLNRFFLETANAFGASFDIPSLHAEYTQISTSADTNTYTIYFTYYKDFGWLGVILGMSTLGAGISWIHRYAMRDYPVAVFLLATAAVGMILSFHAEHFLLGLNYYIKLVVFFFFVYYVAARKFRWKTEPSRRKEAVDQSRGIHRRA